MQKVLKVKLDCISKYSEIQNHFHDKNGFNKKLFLYFPHFPDSVGKKVNKNQR